MSPARVLIFANPISGRGQAARLAAELASALPPQFAPDIILDPPESLPPARLAADPDKDSILIFGGDGTLRAVVAAYVAAGFQAGPPPLLPVPLGTANLMGQYLGIAGGAGKDTIARIIPTLLRRRIMLLDAARANGSPCLLIATVGLDAHVVHALAAARSGPIRKLSYILPTLRALWTYSFPAIRVVADGREIFGPRPGLAFVGNIPQYGTGFPMLPAARPDDGLLDVAVLPASLSAHVIEIGLLAAIRRGGHLRRRGVAYSKARKIEVTSSSNCVPVQVDGEAAGFTPLTVELLPDRLPFLVPV